jgi:outer membrane protein TolC
VGVAKGISLDDLQRSAQRDCPAAPSLEQRADLLAARRQVDVQQRGVNDVWLQFAPTVNLVSRTDISSDVLASQKHETWSIAGVLSIPLWEGGARYGLLRDARAQQQQAEQRLESARRSATVEIAQAQRLVDVTEQARVVAAQSRDLAKESERLARISFQAGKTTSFELIDAGRRLREAELALAVKEFEEVQARLASLLALSSCSW